MVAVCTLRKKKIIANPPPPKPLIILSNLNLSSDYLKTVQKIKTFRGHQRETGCAHSPELPDGRELSEVYHLKKNQSTFLGSIGLMRANHH